jgi:CDP-paratose 2-epimerase
MKLLVTGGCGFVGTNLVAEAMRRGDHVTIVDNLARSGSGDNLEWLRSQGPFDYHAEDTRNFSFIEQLVRDLRPDAVFHLAGQVAMTTSIADPRLDFETNVVGGHNVLESVRRHSPQSVVIYSSTNKVYGDLEWVSCDEAPLRYEAKQYPQGFDEQTPLDFRSPYGCSKGATDQYMLDYARMFGVRTIVFRHSSIFGDRQFSTFDQGWIGWFIKQEIDTKRGTLPEPFTISGNGKQVRDVLFSSDLVRCYYAAVEHADRAQGHAFNIGGGMANSLSLLELFEFLNGELDITLKYQTLPWRQSDQKVFVADNARATKCFGWVPEVRKEEGLRRMIRWCERPDAIPRPAR